MQQIPTPARGAARLRAALKGLTGLAALAPLLLGVALIGGPAAAVGGQTPVGDVRRAVFVGNNWDGTADILAPGSFRQLGEINVIPDYDERMMEISTNPDRLAYFLAIRQAIGEGNDQFVDDMYSSNDGTMVIVSRPSFADVVAISLDTKEILDRKSVV